MLSKLLGKEEESGVNFILYAILSAFIIIPLTLWLSPELIPFNYFGVWDHRGSNPLQWLYAGIPIFIWGFSLTLIFNIKARRANQVLGPDASKLLGHNRSLRSMMMKGLLSSLEAGILEEIIFRWFIYYGFFAILAIVNYCLFGFNEWLYLSILGPLANFTTLGYLEQWLFHPHSWIVGAALLSSNSLFRNGHGYLGCTGIMNSWFLGMFFFYIMFLYGLAASMVVHVLYDLIIFWTVAFIWHES